MREEYCFVFVFVVVVVSFGSDNLHGFICSDPTLRRSMTKAYKIL